MADASNVRSSVEQRRSTAEQWFAYLGRGYIAEYARRADRTTDRMAVVLCATRTWRQLRRRCRVPVNLLTWAGLAVEPGQCATVWRSSVPRRGSWKAGASRHTSITPAGNGASR